MNNITFFKSYIAPEKTLNANLQTFIDVTLKYWISQGNLAYANMLIDAVIRETRIEYNYENVLLRYVPLPDIDQSEQIVLLNNAINYFGR